MSEYLFTSESVSCGHPDKLADQISDAIVDAVLAAAGDQVASARCAVETLVKGDLLVIAGEVTAPGGAPDCFELAQKVARDIGYTDPAYGFNLDGCEKINRLTEQSADIRQGVGDDKVKGAGDQGLMFGYACSETEELMPLPITLAHRLMRKQKQLRDEGVDWLRPDAKAQVTVRYVEGKSVEVTDVVLSTQHDERIDGRPYGEVIKAEVKSLIIDPVLAEAGIAYEKYEPWVNPNGQFITGGPQADAGLTGRKIIVDTYGGSAPHGGGAFSGKDPSKVDRSAAYAARHIAKNIVAAGLAERCQTQLSYAIGSPDPVSLMVETFGTGKRSPEDLKKLVEDHWELSPRGIIETFDLLRPVYAQTAVYGHFGRPDLDLPWEDISLAEKLAG